VRGVEKITASHRARNALVYVRQSTLVQVRDHTESTARQYDLVRWTAQLGWVPEQVVALTVCWSDSGPFLAARVGAWGWCWFELDPAVLLR
jgi:hypothetical protein